MSHTESIHSASHLDSASRPASSGQNGRGRYEKMNGFIPKRNGLPNGGTRMRARSASPHVLRRSESQEQISTNWSFSKSPDTQSLNQLENHLIAKSELKGYMTHPRRRDVSPPMNSSVYIANRKYSHRKSLEHDHVTQTQTMKNSGFPTKQYSVHKKVKTLGRYSGQSLPNDTSFHIGDGPTELSKRDSTFRRGTISKDYVIDSFKLELNPSKHVYHPSDVISGKVMLDIKDNLNIRFVDLMVTGKGTAQFCEPLVGLRKSRKETYLFKRTVLMGSQDSSWTSILTPGQYVTNFKFKLPQNIPSSINYKNPTGEFALNITYTITVRVCDRVGTSSFRSSANSLNKSENFVKVLASKKLIINIQRMFDLNEMLYSAPPLAHTEMATTCCAAFSRKRPSVVAVNSERGVFLAGDNIVLHVEAEISIINNIKHIECQFKQCVWIYTTGEHVTYTIAKLTQPYPQNLNLQHGRKAVYTLSIPTPINLIPTPMEECRLVNVTYNAHIEVKFGGLGQNLTFCVPILIGPCGDAFNRGSQTKSQNLPVFLKPKRFPHFSNNDWKPSKSEDEDSDENSPIEVPESRRVSSDMSHTCVIL